jgi:16S rRNA G966 N2-methylase RsmD
LELREIGSRIKNQEEKHRIECEDTTKFYLDILERQLQANMEQYKFGLDTMLSMKRIFLETNKKLLDDSAYNKELFENMATTLQSQFKNILDEQNILGVEQTKMQDDIQIIKQQIEKLDDKIYGLATK